MRSKLRRKPEKGLIKQLAALCTLGIRNKPAPRKLSLEDAFNFASGVARVSTRSSRICNDFVTLERIRAGARGRKRSRNYRRRIGPSLVFARALGQRSAEKEQGDRDRVGTGSGPGRDRIVPDPRGVTVSCSPGSRNFSLVELDKFALRNVPVDTFVCAGIRSSPPPRFR